ncbi:hypothetical protein NMG60_11021986 [Bertholletia excelsa]
MMPSEDQHHHQAASSSSNSLSTYALTLPIQDQGGFYDKKVHQLKFYQEVLIKGYGGSHGNWDDERESDVGLRLTLWSKEEEDHDHQSQRHEINGSGKWMSSKMRLMKRMTSSERRVTEAPINAQMMKMEDEKQVASAPLETDNSSSTCSYTNSPIRVCSDCNTTKTPLWRSGPNGPKSLCNACGIRQRKARRAAAAAAAAVASGSIPPAAASLVKSKVQHKFKDKKLNMSGHSTVGKYKKRPYYKTAKASTSSANFSEISKKKLCFEDFLVRLSKNQAFHRVFPQDEKEAAILLMALSCGLVHG